MNILKYFEFEKKDDITIYRLKSDQFNVFLNELAEDFRQCYISNESLEQLSAKNEISKSEFLSKYVLPDKGNIKSGDFGEMLSYFSLIERFASKNVSLFCPRKWLWKDRNKAAPYTDVVAFYINGINSESEDILISIESKMKATPSKSHRIQEAIDGANQDKLSRTAKTLEWLKEKYAKEGDIKNKKLVERFANPSEHGSYKKVFKAFVILDKNFEEEEFLHLTNNSKDIVIVVILSDNLKHLYEENLTRIISSVET